MKLENLVVIIRAMAAYWNWDILHDRVERPVFGPLNIEMTDLTTGGENLEGFVGPHYLQDDHYWGRFNEIMDDWSPYDYDYDYEIWQNATRAGKHCYIKTDVYYFHLRDELVCE